MNLPGLHHITAIAGDPRRNVAFYTGVLGLRLVKKTVNFDDPSTYHLYYGDSVGTPGSILTFFPWAGLARGRVGTGQASATAFSVASNALPFWQTRLRAHGVAYDGPVARFGDEVLTFEDPDGLCLELVATAAADPRAPWTHPEIPAGFAIRGFHSVTLAVTATSRTAHLLTEVMRHRATSTEGGRTRFVTGDGSPGTLVDLLQDPSMKRGLQGAGTVHHVAFRTRDAGSQTTDHATLLEHGFNVSPVMDRNYFESIYYREPEGILFEIATDPPGFTVDETPEALGNSLRLPAQYEPHRAQIEAALPPLT
jgi:glyoxalase family protein